MEQWYKYSCQNDLQKFVQLYVVSVNTGITAALLRHEKSLSVMLPEFLKWVSITMQEVAEEAGTPHYPGTDSKDRHL